MDELGDVQIKVVERLNLVETLPDYADDIIADKCSIRRGEVEGLFTLSQFMDNGSTLVTLTLSDKIPLHVIVALHNGCCDDRAGQGYGMLLFKEIKTFRFLDIKIPLNHQYDYNCVSLRQLAEIMKARIELIIPHDELLGRVMDDAIITL